MTDWRAAGPDMEDSFEKLLQLAKHIERSFIVRRRVSMGMAKKFTFWEIS